MADDPPPSPISPTPLSLQTQHHRKKTIIYTRKLLPTYALPLPPWWALPRVSIHCTLPTHLSRSNTQGYVTKSRNIEKLQSQQKRKIVTIRPKAACPSFSLPYPPFPFFFSFSLPFPLTLQMRELISLVSKMYPKLRNRSSVSKVDLTSTTLECNKKTNPAQ